MDESVKARDAICNCFFMAQKDAFELAGQAMGKQQSDDELRTIICESVKTAFRRAGANWDKPSRDDLIKVVQDLGQKALAFGTPPEIIQRHQASIMAAIATVPEQA